MYSNVYSSYAGGGGGGYGMGTPSASSGYAPKSDISYDTSSKDPLAQRARVFVGNLNTTRVTREDVIQLFRAYGTLAGVTLFKGYAFVQYSSATDADLSVSALNGYNWNGSVLDVKLAVPAVAGMKPTGPANTFGTKRSTGPEVSAGAKRVRPTPEQANSQNKSFAESLTEMPAIVEHPSHPDTLICGECRFITTKLADFIEHRKKPCTFFKAEGEPIKLQCFTCTDEFSDSWSLVRHLTTTHKLVLYKEPTDEEEEAKPTNGDGEMKTDPSTED